MENQKLFDDINKLKKERNAVIVAHNYQVDEVQDIADKVGDSFALSKYCSQAEASVIVFCGVHFMAESAKILSPQKTVLLPEKDAGCPMADMVTAEGLKELKKQHPDASVICYINSSAEVKAEADICCTSSNALKVVKSVSAKKIIFAPDQNLGSYVANQVPDKEIILWKGFCITHHRVRPTEVEKVRELYPEALLLVHPECQPDVVAMADFVGSTKEIIEYATASNKKQFIIGTEMGVLRVLKRNNPDKSFYLLTQGLVCPNMKKTSLKSVHSALMDMKYEVNVPEDIRVKARTSLDRMLEIG